MADLKTNYVDDKLNASTNQLRKYQLIKNDDGTVSLVDVTDYTATGTSFGANDINATNKEVNKNTSDIVALNLKLNQKGKRIAPLKVSQTNMTVHDTVIYELPLLNIVFMSVTFSINSGGNIQLFIIEDKYRPVEKSKLLISNHAIGATAYTDGKIAYDSDGHGLTLGIGTYTMIGMYRYFV
jgi:hypothetical protein